jgi:hypothetical protein
METKTELKTASPGEAHAIGTMETKTESKTASPVEAHAIGTINWMPVVFAQ